MIRRLDFTRPNRRQNGHPSRLFPLAKQRTGGWWLVRHLFSLAEHLTDGDGLVRQVSPLAKQPTDGRAAVRRLFL
jgi:hypothetical protein